MRFRTAAGAPILTILRRNDSKLAYFNEVTRTTKAGPAVSSGAWHDLEVHVLVNGNSSLVEIWIDGTKVSQLSKTDALGTTPVGRVYIGDPAGGRTFDYAFDNEMVWTKAGTVPTTPTALSVTGTTQSSVSVTWGASASSTGIAGYNLLENGSVVATTTQTSFTFGSLPCGTSFTFGVAGLDTAGQVSSPATLIAATSPCGITTPSPVSDLQFPAGLPGPAGTTLPEHGCADPSPSVGCVLDNGFNRSDYAGWGSTSGTNDRMKWVQDPSGSGKTVAQFNVYGTDVSDQFSQVKANLWRTPSDNCDGCDAWFAVGFYIPSGFVFPDTWFLLMQNHGGAGNPAQAIELRTPPGGGSVRNYIYWKNQTAPTSGWTYFPLAPVQEGHWVYVVAHIYLTTTENGYAQVWYHADSLPNISLPPLVDDENINTLYPGYGTGTASLPLYRDASSDPNQHQIVDYCGYHRAATAAVAMTLPHCPGA